MRLDHWNLLPEAVLKASPFHTTVFLTNLKSLGIDSIFHHLYEFGTNGFLWPWARRPCTPFPARTAAPPRAGRSTWTSPWTAASATGCTLPGSMRLFRKFLRDPALLETRLERTEEDLP